MNHTEGPDHYCSGTGRYFEVKRLKRYAIGFLIALFVLAGMDGYKRPGGEPRFSAILVAAAWPIVITIAVGSTIGEGARCGAQDPACAGRSGGTRAAPT